MARRLALIGFGKMNRLIAELAPEFDCEVALRLRSSENVLAAGITAEAFAGIDVAIEFTTPEAVVANVTKLAAIGVPTVTGTTGWFGQLPTVTQAVQRGGGGLVWSPNFSVGVAVFERLVAMAASLFQFEPEYGAWAWEIHHDAKKDAPSGTLLHLVESMRRHGYERNIDTAASRAGKHPGTHEVGFDSAADTITLRHVARSREGFARGALKAAQWIAGRQGVYTLEDVLFGPSASLSEHKKI